MKTFHVSLTPVSALLLSVFLSTCLFATAFSLSNTVYKKYPLSFTTRQISNGWNENIGYRNQRSVIILNDNNNSDDTNSMTTRESDQLLLGAAGTVASCVMLYSEFVLSQTGCGLPAGPLGLVGAVEGISYLSVAGLGGYSLFQKVTTGSGLPAGKFGLLGLAEGMAFLALFAGAIVLVLQVTNYGYIPNAVPMEGAMCK